MNILFNPVDATSDIEVGFEIMPGEPVASLIVFCDHIIAEQGTGKVSLIGTFQQLASPSFPFIYPRLFVHVAVTNFIPDDKQAHLAINLKHRQSGAVVASLPVPLNFSSIPKGKIPPNGIRLNFNLPLQNLMFSSPGIYDCEVLFNSEKIGDSFLEILQVPQQPLPFQAHNPPQS